MGLSKEHRCSKCGYNEVVSGGSDAGMMVAVETHICKDCLILTDVTTMWFMHENPEMRHKEIAPEDYECNECGSPNVVVWDTEKKPCPKCGNKMTTGEGIEMLWD